MPDCYHETKRLPPFFAMTGAALGAGARKRGGQFPPLKSSAPALRGRRAALAQIRAGNGLALVGRVCSCSWIEGPEPVLAQS
jgi:hypothetical protein